MATLNTLSYSVLEQIRPSIGKDDYVDHREIKFEITNQRALWIKNDLSKPGRTIDQGLLQTICIEMENADPSECCGVDTRCTVKRSTVDIPDIIEVNWGSVIYRIGPVDLTKPSYTIIDALQAQYVGNGRFNKNALYAFIYRNKLHLVSNANSLLGGIQRAAISAIFENPEDARTFNGCDGQVCYSDDSPYPLNTWMWNYIKPQVVKQFIPQLYIQADDRNDAAHKQIIPQKNAESKEEPMERE